MHDTIYHVQDRKQRFINEAQTARMVRLARAGRPGPQWRIRLAKLFHTQADTTSRGHRSKLA